MVQLEFAVIVTGLMILVFVFKFLNRLGGGNDFRLMQAYAED